MSRTFKLALAAVVALAFNMPTYGQISIWKDDDPVTSGVSATSGFLIVDQIADPTGDPDRAVVGDVSTLVANEFSNMRPEPSAPQPLQPEFIGQSYSFTMDYYVPSSSSMQNNLGQTFFLSLNFRDDMEMSVEQVNAGFISYDAAMLDTWQTIEITGVVPAGVVDAVPLMVFNNAADPQPGTAVYVDNVDFTIEGVAIVQSPIWVDDDPTTMDVSATSGGLIVTQIMDPTGDPDRVLVGELDNSASTQNFTNMRPAPAAPQEVPPEFIGLPYSFTLDYYIPTESTMQQNLNQRVFISLNFRDMAGTSIETRNNGFIGYDIGAPLDTWGTMQITGVIPEGTFDVVPLMVFNNNGTFPAGPAAYVDNVNFSAEMIVEVEGCEFELGDVNQDGVANLLDVAPFVAAITEGEFICEADVNEDGVVNLLDVAPFVAILTGG